MFNKTEWQFFYNLLQNLVTVKEEIIHTKNIVSKYYQTFCGLFVRNCTKTEEYRWSS